MSNISKALLWASAIIIAALFTQAMGFEQSESFVVTSGLVAGAWISLYSEGGCSRGCLK